MKFILVLTFLIASLHASAGINKKPPVCYTSASMVMIESEYLASEDLRASPQLEWLAFEVIGFIISELMPAIFTEICTELGGNPQLCNAGGQAISFLLSLEEGNLHIGETGGIHWKVSRGKKESYVSFKTRDKYISQRLKQLLLSYSENCAKDLIWKKIIDLDYNNININYAYNRPCRHIQLQNNIGRGLKWSASVDGTIYKSSNLPVDFHEGPGLFGDMYPFKPIEINFTSDASLPYYFNDGIYVRLMYNGYEQNMFLRYDKRYVLNRNADGSFQTLPYDLEQTR